MFSQACVKNSVYSVYRVYIPACTGADTLPGQMPPQVDTPCADNPRAETPRTETPGQTSLSRRLLQRTVRILLEHILVY